MKQVINIIDPKKQKTIKVGILQNGVFIKKVDPEKHLMRKLNSYGIQEDAIKILVNKFCQIVRIITPTETLESNFTDWLVADIKVLNFGSGLQRFYPVNRMRMGGL